MAPLAKLTGKKFLVTGGTGFIGRNLIVMARKMEGEVISLSRTQGTDLCDEGIIRNTIKDYRPDFIIHLASLGVTQSQSLEELRRVNVSGFKNLLDASVAEPNPPKLILVGSGFEYGPSDSPIPETGLLNPVTDYGRSKLEACKLAEEYSDRLELTWLRAFNIYGPGEASNRLLPYLVSCAINGIPAEVTDGLQTRDFTEVNDLTEAILRFAQMSRGRPGWLLSNLGSGRPAQLKDYMYEIKQCLQAHGISLRLHLGAKPHRPGDPRVYVPDITLMKSLLRWMPQTSLEVGVSLTVKQLLGRK